MRAGEQPRGCRPLGSRRPRSFVALTVELLAQLVGDLLVEEVDASELVLEAAEQAARARIRDDGRGGRLNLTTGGAEQAQGQDNEALGVHSGSVGVTGVAVGPGDVVGALRQRRRQVKREWVSNRQDGRSLWSVTGCCSPFGASRASTERGELEG